MHISDVNATTHRSDSLNKTGVGGAEPVSPGREAAEEKPETRSDRIEISDDARNASRSSEELSFARNALQNLPELSEARTAQLKERIQNGYYSNPDVLQTIAERLGNELAGGSV